MSRIEHLEAFRFLVPSFTDRKKFHLIDLELWDGNGECMCENFQFRIRPQLARGEAPGNWSQCSHIRALATFLMREVVKRTVAARDTKTVPGPAPAPKIQCAPAHRPSREYQLKPARMYTKGFDQT